MTEAGFADRLIEAVRRIGAPLCIGVDIFPERIPALFGDARADPRAIANFTAEIIALAPARASIIKPQLGLFEPYGAEGFEIARAACAEAKQSGLLVLLDAKRGDIGTTAEGYARASLGRAPGFDADCVTINPYLGLDSLEPFFKAAEAAKKGVAVLVRTSNPGARDVQDLEAAGEPVWAHVAKMLAPQAERLRGASGWSGLMVVAGATWPAEAKKLRGLLPNALFLVPGYGAQGASAADAVAGFTPGPKGLEGGVVSSSRAILYPKGAEAAQSLAEWRALIAGAMDAAHAELAAAIRV
ncbi:MAG: orotidine-5'-phosphate decarboxylase [Hyphomonadaceae bacterium]